MNVIFYQYWDWYAQTCILFHIVNRKQKKLHRYYETFFDDSVPAILKTTFYELTWQTFKKNKPIPSI